MVSKKEKILLLGDNLRSTIAVSESLFRNGFEVHVVGWWGIPLNKSKWIEKHFNIPRWDLDLQKGITQFTQILAATNYKVIIPINDDAIEIGVKYKSLITKHTKMLGFPAFEKWKFARDKSTLLKKFKALGLGGPNSVLIDNYDEIATYTTEIKFPFIIKPCSSRLLVKETIKVNSVQKIHSPEEWKGWKSNPSNFPVLIQEYIGGRELGFNFYAENGNVLNFYIDEQLHGLIGSEASYRTIADLNDNQKTIIRDVFTQFIQSIEWDGIGMFDFKLYDNRVYIIEFNCRFWASIALSKKTGSDLIQLFIDRKLLEKPLKEIIISDTKKGSIRNMKNDLVYSLNLLKKRDICLFFSWTKSLFKIFSKNEYIEDSLFNDFNFRFYLFKWRLLNVLKK